jgi:hypothetical protein
MMPKKIISNNPPLTKKRFETILRKVFTTRANPQELLSGSKVGQTSVFHPSDGYSDRGKSQDNLGDKKG